MMASNHPDDKCTAVGNILLDQKRPLAERFRALFTLRNIGGEGAVRAISECFEDPSELLKHECAYCLGQMQDKTAVPVLASVLQNVHQETMVRHEAGEALGAIGCEEMLDLLTQYCHDPVVEVAETCQLAVERIKWLHNNKKTSENLSKNPYRSVDPAPPCEELDTGTLHSILMDESRPLFERYRTMFALRNRGDEKSVVALADGLKCSSALFRHEIAYILGQMQHAAGVDQLKANLVDGKENAMVRHECAEALGSIATPECMDILQEYAKDQERVVKESCEVALDMCAYENSEQFQYADGLDRIGQVQT